MQRPIENRDGFDLYDDLMVISRLEASIGASRRRNVPTGKDFSRLAQFVPGLKL
ncbi:MAG: hypothetical protein KDK12_20755 [Rhodobacteraceae bacterium]|nr:hypothetical protein [Paracoccaceae bacterium]